jgi:hypothetical protein
LGWAAGLKEKPAPGAGFLLTWFRSLIAVGQVVSMRLSKNPFSSGFRHEYELWAALGWPKKLVVL